MNLRQCAAVFSLAASPLAAQGHGRIEGDWQAKTSDGIHHIMVRGDSSAQFGEQVARWRMVGDSLWITLGDGAWQVYGMKLVGDRLTLSGGDLDAPVVLRRTGAAAPRPPGLVVPAAPPDTARAAS